MTNKQQRDLHEKLAPTETAHTPQGLPICDDLQIAQRQGVIRQWEKDRKLRRMTRR